MKKKGVNHSGAVLIKIKKKIGEGCSQMLLRMIPDLQWCRDLFQRKLCHKKICFFLIGLFID